MIQSALGITSPFVYFELVFSEPCLQGKTFFEAFCRKKVCNEKPDPKGNAQQKGGRAQNNS